MLNSYHYCYYYCYDYDYDDCYPSYCCYSILLNDFLSFDEHDLLHLETTWISCVPLRDYSNGKPLTFYHLHPIWDLQTFYLPPLCYGLFIQQTHLSPADRHLAFFDNGFHKLCWFIQYLENEAHADLIYRSLWTFLFSNCVWTMHTTYMFPAGLFQPIFTSISDCLLSQQDVVSNILTRGW